MKQKKVLAIIFIGITLSFVTFGIFESTNLFNLGTKHEWVEESCISKKNIELAPFIFYTQFLMKPEVNGTATSVLKRGVFFSLTPNIMLSANSDANAEVSVEKLPCNATNEQNLNLSTSNIISYEERTSEFHIMLNYNDSAVAVFIGKQINLTLDMNIHQIYYHKFHWSGFRLFGGHWIDEGKDQSKTPFHKVKIEYSIADMKTNDSYSGRIYKDDYITNGTWDFNKGPFPYAAKTYMEIHDENKYIASHANVSVGASTICMYSPLINETTFLYDPLIISSSIDLGAGIERTNISLQFSGKIQFNRTFPNSSNLNEFYPGWHDLYGSGEIHFLEMNQLVFGDFWIREIKNNTGI
ncbi:MAG: hypothetical protein ACTSWL_04255 [Promethearchaeota archaeon]